MGYIRNTKLSVGYFKTICMLGVRMCQTNALLGFEEMEKLILFTSFSVKMKVKNGQFIDYFF